MLLPQSLRVLTAVACAAAWAAAITSVQPARADQGARRARVVVSSHGQPVSGALVKAGPVTAATDADGVAILVLAPGRHLVEVAAEHFAPASGTIVVEPGGEDPTLAIEIEPSLEIEEEVIVAATRSERRLQDEPLRVEVVDREEIEEKALMTPGSVAMLLAETTGLRVQTTAPSTGSAAVRIQGLRGHYTQMLSDGLPLYGVQGDALSLLQVPPLDLGRVEIIKGPASALYGASALGGVINLVSQRPAGAQRQILLNRSTQDATDLSVWLTQPLGAWGFTVLGGAHGQSRQDVDGDGWADLPAFTRGVVRPRVFWDDRQGRSFFATVGVIAENRTGGTMPGGTTPGGEAHENRLDTRRADAGAVYRHLLGRGWLLTARGSFARNAQRRDEAGTIERGRRLTWFGETALQGSAGRHVWVAGAALQQDAYHATDLPAFSYRHTAPGLFVQDEIALTPRLTLGASLRLDAHSTVGTFLSPRVSALLRPGRGWNVRLSAGSGFFAPTPFLEDTEETGLSRVLPPGRLVAERAWGFSADAGWTGGPVELSGTLFASRVNHATQLRGAGDLYVELVNAARPTNTAGTEALFRYRRGSFLVLATHNYTWSAEDDPESGRRREVPLTPRHTASLNAIWEDESWGRVGVECYYIGSQALDDDPYRQRGREHVLVGVLAEKRLGPVRVFLNAENLGDVRQTRYAPLVRPRQAPGGSWTVDAWAPLDGRVFNGGVRFLF